jgi:ankyrin repeat protein
MMAKARVTALQLAGMVEHGDVRGVAEALRADPSLVAAKTPDGDTPLHLACWQKQIAIIGTIVAYRPDLNARGCYGRTPLHYAVHEGRAISVPIVGILLAMGADPSLRDDNGFSVEDWAKIEMYDGLAEVLDMLRRSAGGSEPEPT